MRPTVEFKTIVIALSFFMLTLLVLLSVACDKNKPANSDTAQNQGTNATPSSNQSNAPEPAITPNTNSPANGSAPSIQITVVPSKGAGPDELETVAGTVSGVDVKECKVVIFARTNTWYVQPYIDSPDTVIRDDGTWHNDTHLGSEYAAILVKASYRPPSTTGKLPATGGLILAVAKATAK